MAISEVELGSGGCRSELGLHLGGKDGHGWRLHERAARDRYRLRFLVGKEEVQ